MYKLHSQINHTMSLATGILEKKIGKKSKVKSWAKCLRCTCTVSSSFMNYWMCINPLINLLTLKTSTKTLTYNQKWICLQVTLIFKLSQPHLVPQQQLYCWSFPIENFWILQEHYWLRINNYMAYQGLYWQHQWVGQYNGDCRCICRKTVALLIVLTHLELGQCSIIRQMQPLYTSK